MNKNKISIALAALALLLGTGVGITSCTDEVDNFDPARGNHTAGQLGIVSLSSDGKVLPARGGSPSAASTDTRATNDDGTSVATANRAIRSFEAGDVVTTRYHFVDITSQPVPEASIYTCTATATASAAGPTRGASTLAWAMDAKSIANPLKPTRSKTPTETWDEARMEIGYAASPKADATLPNGTTLIAANATGNRSQMAYLLEESAAQPAPAASSVRQYYDALVASTLGTATANLPGKPASGTALTPGTLYIERAKGTDQGAVTANLAHRGALMRLTPDKITISGFVEGFDCLTDLLACATIKEGAAGSETETDVYVRFSSVTLTGGDVVWQAIVPAGAVVKQFIATIGVATKDEPTRAASTSTTPSATYYIPLTNPTAAMAANTSYPLKLTLTPDLQTLVVGTAPALPGWPSDDEKEWVNTEDKNYAIDVKDCDDDADLTAKLKAAYTDGKTEWTVIGKAGDKWGGTTDIAFDSDITAAINIALKFTAANNSALKFTGATARISLSLPAVTSIDYDAFFGCKTLTTIDLPEAMTIGETAFSACTALTTVSLSKATSIGLAAFSGCAALTTVSLPKATSIDKTAFNACKALTTLSFGSIITTWGEKVLAGVTTSNVTLTLAPGQTDFKKDGTGTTDVVVGFGTDKSFAGYTFKEIKQAQ